MKNEHRVAVIIPCLNEEGAIGKTVSEFKRTLPDADIYVYDNNSTDNTILEARNSGALVYKEKRQGKGHVVKRMFFDVEADVYILVDGDNTYDATIAPFLVEQMLREKIDMITATRNFQDHSFPPGHILGNRIFSKLINTFFNAELTDVFSGYRFMTRRFVKSIPIVSNGFEIETELTVHAQQIRASTLEVPSNYGSRPIETKSKLSTYSDGFKILRFILFLLRDVKPFLFFSAISFMLTCTSLSLGVPVISEFYDTGLVERFPTAILSSGIGLIAVMCFFTGIILDSISRSRLETKKINFLSITNNIENL
ncbi:glycosyltransferase family 2 protein [Vibrio sp. ZSDZ34]|uniref:Glycosyltransferase family 2 protein n=1 Tax=Vibrio gelatinilyticus TaxID=2893468 RepID=A0A9X2AZ36_9VIBR|nr:glycosyltransferase family 2 protein [Vibrio gelatinilyticus]MCJ2377128.1 glycosyltransferase family 2 protein [Vibrio gelatinilyticus]